VTSGQKRLRMVGLLRNLEGRMGMCQTESHAKATLVGSMVSEIVSDQWPVIVLNMGAKAGELG